jgi:hypothetical protein
MHVSECTSWDSSSLHRGEARVEVHRTIKLCVRDEVTQAWSKEASSGTQKTGPQGVTELQSKP